MSDESRVIAVIVAYAPDPDRFASVLAAAAAQANAVIVVDNGAGARLDRVQWSATVEHIDMHGNVGIAAAQNVGIRRAYERGATHALLLDHDSVLQRGAVEALLTTWTTLTSKGELVAAVGANYRDPRRPAMTPFIRIKGCRYTRVPSKAPHSTVSVSYLVSSGSLISREAFEAIGPMNEPLFIDYVDIEWGFRAGLLGWNCFGVIDAEMNHSLGDLSLRIAGLRFPLHSPARHYYMARNVSWLVSRTSIPIGCKIAEGWRMLKRSLAYTVFAPQPHRHALAVLEGLKDGLRGRLGS